MIKRILAGAFGAALAICSAQAADLYRPDGAGGLKDGVYAPAPLWTGFYVGVNGGYAWSAEDSKVSADVEKRRRNVDPSAKFDEEGGFGGGQIGYNYQIDRILLGVEADLQGGDVSGDKTVTASLSNGHHEGVADAKSALDYFGTVRGRIGYTFDRSLVYATGGFAYGGVKDTLAVTATSHGFSSASSASADETATGYVVGGGLEYAFTPSLSGKIEYQYIDLGSDRLDGKALAHCTHAAGEATFDHAYNTVRVGLNYHIAPGYEPLK